uniref:MINDY deubiquitinase domain-containing protein n=1 Tax=Rhizophora mucronata TaxID=61149 RepID=A0A2P2M4Y4_RHIMU
MSLTQPLSSSSTGDEQIQREQSQPLPAKEKECVHKTKTIQFLGRTTPIVLQNDNGPCPLLAICNVLLLRNNLNLSPDMSEVSQEKLLSLVAERLIDSNSNVNNKDAGYVENQQQNIADAIDSLPRLATGVDVNIKFRRIDDFEFTSECAIFDLLDIPLYHGWIVDPQDYDTANAIGSKSYNALTAELVALEAQKIEGGSKDSIEEDCIDLAAATTAALGVPSPCLSKSISSDDSPHSVSDQQKPRKGDLEEEAELLRALKMSEAELLTSVGDSHVANFNGGLAAVDSDGSTFFNTAGPVDSINTSKDNINFKDKAIALINDSNKVTNLEALQGEIPCSPSHTDQGQHCNQSTDKECKEFILRNDAVRSAEALVQVEDVQSLPCQNIAPSVDDMDVTQTVAKVENQSASMIDVHHPVDILSGHDTEVPSGPSAVNTESDSSGVPMLNMDAPETFTSSVDSNEPLYEGEECILDSGTAAYEDQEPMYEGEVILVKQADKTVRSVDEINPQQGKLVRNFLNNNASQLTFYGLFRLQGGLKERELCVFFRNNHFSTMFKYDGGLYLLATDQGYLNQPDLVWEKLNEVNGDSLFMTANFREFKMESHTNDTWNEHNATTSTADYLASIDSPTQAGLHVK